MVIKDILVDWLNDFGKKIDKIKVENFLCNWKVFFCFYIIILLNIKRLLIFFFKYNVLCIIYELRYLNLFKIYNYVYKKLKKLN